MKEHITVTVHQLSTVATVGNTKTFLKVKFNQVLPPSFYIPFYFNLFSCTMPALSLTLFALILFLNA